MLTLLFVAFVLATFKASFETSTAKICAFGKNLANEIAMQPLPVPISRMLISLLFLLSLIIQSTSSSVSGRGINTELFTSKFNP